MVSEDMAGLDRWKREVLWTVTHSKGKKGDT